MSTSYLEPATSCATIAFTDQQQVQVYINIVAVTAGLHADNLHVGIFSMQE